VAFTQFVAHIRKEWQTVKGAPFTFVVTVLLCLGIGYTWAGHEDKGHEQSLSDLLTLEKSGRANEQLLLQQRIGSKDDLLTDYRSKLLIADMKGQLSSQSAPRITETQRQFSRAATRFSNATNEELRSMGIKLAQQIRALTQKASTMADQGITDQQSFLAAIREATFEYQSKYQADAIVLRDELVSRLPLLPRPIWQDLTYSNANNTHRLEDIASDLETLAKKLPVTGVKQR